jgi:hypothetical protein
MTTTGWSIATKRASDPIGNHAVRVAVRRFVGNSVAVATIRKSWSPFNRDYLSDRRAFGALRDLGHAERWRAR